MKKYLQIVERRRTKWKPYPTRRIILNVAWVCFLFLVVAFFFGRE